MSVNTGKEGMEPVSCQWCQVPGQACSKAMSTIYLVRHPGDSLPFGSPGFSYTVSVQRPSLGVCSQTPSQSQRDEFSECLDLVSRAQVHWSRLNMRNPDSCRTCHRRTSTGAARAIQSRLGSSTCQTCSGGDQQVFVVSLDPYLFSQWMGEKVMSSQRAEGQEWAAVSVKAVFHLLSYLQGHLKSRVLKSMRMDEMGSQQRDTQRYWSDLSLQLKRIAVNFFPVEGWCW